MAEIRPLLILDTTAILAGKTPQWQEWDRFSQCVLPQAVFDEIKYLTKRSADPQEEAIVREFARYVANSNFQISDASALVDHIGPEDQSLSKRARLENAIAECVYALAKQQVGTLTVLVSNDRPLVERVTGLQISNLCAISVAELLHWIRQQQRPHMITQALSNMPGPPIPASAIRSDRSGRPDDPMQRSVAIPSGQSTPSRSQPTDKRLQPTPSDSGSRSIFQSLINGVVLLISVTLLAGSGLILWRVADPVSSGTIWKLLRLPDLSRLDRKGN